MVMQPADAVEQSSYIRILCEAEFKESITADGDYEVSFGGAATLALTPDAAEKLYWMLGAKMAALRAPAASIRPQPLPAGSPATPAKEMGTTGC